MKFMENLPDAELRWIDECGHVPHLEQAKQTASIIKEFLENESLVTSESTSAPDFTVVGAIAAAGLAGAAATMVASF